MDVELIFPELVRNSIIISEVSLEQAKQRLEDLHMELDHTLAHLCLERSYIVSTLKS